MLSTFKNISDSSLKELSKMAIDVGKAGIVAVFFSAKENNVAAIIISVSLTIFYVYLGTYGLNMYDRRVKERDKGIVMNTTPPVERVGGKKKKRRR